MITFFRKLWRDKRGNAIVIAAAALPLVLGSAVVADGIAALVREAQARNVELDSILVDTALEKPDGNILKRLRLRLGGSFEAITLIAPSDRGHLGEYRQAGYATFLARPVRGEGSIMPRATRAR